MHHFVSAYFGQVTGKKNSKTIAFNRRTGKPFVRMNDKAKMQELEMVLAFKEDFRSQGFKYDAFKNTTVEVRVEIWNKDNRKHDLDNQVSTVLDALVKAKVIFDDSQNTVIKLVVEYKGVDKYDPRAEITISEV